MPLKQKLTQWIREQQFSPTLLGAFVNPLFLARLELVRAVERLAPHCRGRVLDIGCGRKPYQHLFSAEEYIGLELDSERGRMHGTADVYYSGDSFPFESASFDSVVCFQVLEHVFHPEAFIAELSRVLRPNGKLLLTVPFIWGEHEQPHDFGRYSSFGVKDLLSRNDLEILSQEKTLLGLGLLFQLLNCYVYRLTFTGRPKLDLILTALLHGPINVIGSLFLKIRIAGDELYADNVVVAKKVP